MLLGHPVKVHFTLFPGKPASKVNNSIEFIVRFVKIWYKTFVIAYLKYHLFSSSRMSYISFLFIISSLNIHSGINYDL